MPNKRRGKNGQIRKYYSEKQTNKKWNAQPQNNQLNDQVTVKKLNLQE